MFRLGVITDEVSQDLKAAIDFALEFGLRGLEIRTAGGKNIMDMTTDEVKEIRKMADGSGLEVPSISSPVFKCDLADEETVRKHMDGLKKCLDFSGILEASVIRFFDFLYNENHILPDEQRYEKLHLAADLAEPYSITLALENEPIVYSSTFSNISETVRTLGRHNVKALYDPGNAVYCDSSEPPYPEGYELIRDILCHIHIKDAKRVKGEVVSTDLGEGAVDYRGIFQRLFDDGYEGYIILET
ncbi:MAG TPA: sugar phosphate isomerase/epimerase, partial [Clostridiales bacterium]|nr:sugar phosphate isomerase/epimerase [Clostridiales bacterium]